MYYFSFFFLLEWGLIEWTKHTYTYQCSYIIEANNYLWSVGRIRHTRKENQELSFSQKDSGTACCEWRRKKFRKIAANKHYCGDGAIFPPLPSSKLILWDLTRWSWHSMNSFQPKSFQLIGSQRKGEGILTCRKRKCCEKVAEKRKGYEKLALLHRNHWWYNFFSSQGTYSVYKAFNSNYSFFAR